MYQGFIDDSTSDGVLVLGGYISSREKWLTFSKDWKEMLDNLGIPEFKMNLMNQSAEGRKQAEQFYRLIERHVLHRIAVVAPIQEVKEAVRAFNWPAHVRNTRFFDNPYFLKWLGVYSCVDGERREAKIERPIELIFDSQSEKGEILKAWRDFEASAHQGAIDATGGKPQFGDSKLIFPLQAADFYAWWCRKWFAKSASLDETEKAIDEQAFPWEIKVDIRHLTIKLSKEIVTGVLNTMFKS